MTGERGLGMRAYFSWSVGLWACLLWAAAAPPAAADVAKRVNFQGRLVDPATKNPQNGSFDLTFRICDSLAASCAGAAKLWEETQTVSVDNGVFETTLGDAVAIDSSVFAGSARYLEIQVEAQVLSPRQRLVSVPTALRAEVAESLAFGAIRLQDTLQAGATFFVSSGTVATDFFVNGLLRARGNLRLDGTLTAGSGANQLTSAAGLLDAAKLDPGSLVPNASLDPSSVAKLSAGLIPNSHIDASSVTKLGNAFNGANQLLRLDGAGLVPDAELSAAVTLQGNAFNGANQLLRLNASALVPGTALDASSVTKQGNAFNAADQLVRLDASGRYPALDGSLITNVNDATKLPLAGGTMTGAVNFNVLPALDTANQDRIEISTHVRVVGTLAATQRFAQVYDAAGGATITDVFSAIAFNAQTVVDAIFSHSTTLNPSRVTALRSGLYRVAYSAGLDAATNTRTVSHTRCLINGVTAPVPSEAYSYHRVITPGENSPSAEFLLNLSANDYIEIQAQSLVVGANLTTIANASWLLVEFVR